jgi:pimeloyl-ACP methyl ester carboxylesterase
VRQQFNRPHLVRLLERFHELEFLEPHELQGLSMPAHLVWGLDDYVLPSSHLDFYRTHLPPGSHIETPATYGHAPFLHHADELAESLLRFMRRLD